jgi:archaellum biogenesis ATPase FlaH
VFKRAMSQSLPRGIRKKPFFVIYENNQSPAMQPNSSFEQTIDNLLDYTKKVDLLKNTTEETIATESNSDDIIDMKKKKRRTKDNVIIVDSTKIFQQHQFRTSQRNIPAFLHKLYS